MTERLNLPGSDSVPWGELVDTACIPGGGELQLYRQDDDYEIRFEEEQLMGSWSSRSEEALATLVADRLDGRAAEVLIGGLGMGFTLAAARAVFAPETEIMIAELVPQVVAWARGPLAHIFGGSLADPRVKVEIADVHDVIVENPARFDAILLDVDNGPDGLIQLANERLYSMWGLRAACSALRDGGMLAVWSAYADPSFSDRLKDAGFDVEVLAVDGDGRDGHAPHVIWLATKQN